MFKIETPSFCSEELLKKYVNLDQSVFPEAEAITWERATVFEEKNPGNISFLYDENTLIGAISVLFIKKEVPDNAQQKDTPIYKLLRGEDLDSSEKQGILYIHNVLIDLNYQGQGLSSKLAEALVTQVKQKSKIQEVWGDAVSQGGLHFLEKIGLKPTYEYSDKSKLCFSWGENFINHINNL